MTEGVVELPQSLRDSPLREGAKGAKEKASLTEGGGPRSGGRPLNSLSRCGDSSLKEGAKEKPPSLREGDREAVAGVVGLPQSLRRQLPQGGSQRISLPL